MRILVLSDSHRNVRNMLQAVEREKPDLIWHLGDLSRDAEELSDQLNWPVVKVSGNCDMWSLIGMDDAATREITVEGVKFMLTHGHLYQAKQGSGALLREGRRRGMDAVLYGHTHVPRADQQEDGLWLINPGTAGGVGNSATCAVIEVQDGKIRSAEIKRI